MGAGATDSKKMMRVEGFHRPSLESSASQQKTLRSNHPFNAMVPLGKSQGPAVRKLWRFSPMPLVGPSIAYIHLKNLMLHGKYSL